MNYEKIYNQIVARAKTRKLEGYKERHHIIPKCMGGTNDKENLVLLTAREHFICHWLLVRIYPNNKKLIYSFHAMCKQNKSGNRYLPSSRVYKEAKELFKQTYIPWNKGKKGISKNPNAGKSMIEIFGLDKANEINRRKSNTLKLTFSDPIIKEKLKSRKPRNSYTMSDEVKAKISNTLKNKYSNGLVQNGMTGKQHSESTKQLIRNKKLK